MWFEIEAGQPKIGMKRGGSDEPRKRAPEPGKRVKPEYPLAMLKRSSEADVYARADIDERGSVVAVEAQGLPRQDGVHRFELEVRETLSSWVFPARAEKWRYCVVVHFRLRG